MAPWFAGYQPIARFLAGARHKEPSGWVAAPLAAGALYQWQPVSPFLLSALVPLAVVAVVVGMPEAPRPAVRQPGVRTQVRAALHTVAGQPAIVVLLLFGWAWDLGITVTNVFSQAYFPALGLSMAASGAVLAFGHLGSLLGSGAAERLRSGTAAVVLRLAPLAVAVAILGMGLGRAVAAAAWLPGPGACPPPARRSPAARRAGWDRA